MTISLCTPLEVFGQLTKPALRSLKVSSLPTGEVGGSLVGTLQEGQERRVRIRTGANGLVWQQEFSELGVERRGRWFDLGKVEAIRCRISIAVEGGMIDAWPKAGTRNFAAICFPSHGVGHVRHAARMRRRIASREAGHRQVEAAPKQMDRTAFAAEARTKQQKDPLHL